MIVKHEATTQVQRFGNQPYWGMLTDEAMEELVKAIQSAQTVEQAKLAVDWLLEYGEDRITTQQIYLRLRETPVTATVERDRGCRTCRGTGYALAWHIQCEVNASKRRFLRRALCHSCTENSGECEYRIVPNDKPVDIAGLFYCQARIRQMQWPIDLGHATGIGPIETSHPCPDCAFGRTRGAAYSERETERVAKKAGAK